MKKYVTSVVSGVVIGMAMIGITSCVGKQQVAAVVTVDAGTEPTPPVATGIMTSEPPTVESKPAVDPAHFTTEQK
jgi:hypothetical protein